MMISSATGPAEELDVAQLDYRAVLASIAAAQACTPTARAAAALARVKPHTATPNEALVNLMRSGAWRTDAGVLRGSFHPGVADQIGGITSERSIKAAFTLGFQGSFKAAGVNGPTSDNRTASVRHL